MRQFKLKEYGVGPLGTYNWRLKLSNLLVAIGLISGLTACTSAEDEALSAGSGIYKDVCKVCHAQGINGAPILGNKKMWAKRVPQGLNTLVEHAMNGYGLMPAKGGRTELTEEEISNAVKYMLSHLEG